jgi:hypothetical protein
MLGGFALAGGVVALYRLIAARRSARARIGKKLRRMPRTPLGEVKDGTHVKVAGEIRILDEPLVSPLGGSRCVWYEVVVHAQPDGRRWKVVARDEHSIDFLLTEGDARALVRMRSPNVGAEVKLRLVKEVFERHPWPEPAAALVRRSGGDPDRLPYYRIEESSLSIHGRIVVAGHAFYEDDPDAVPLAQDYRHAARPQRVVISATSRVPLLLCDNLDVA